MSSRASSTAVMCAVPSEPSLATDRPSGLNATQLMKLSWMARSSSRALSASQTLVEPARVALLSAQPTGPEDRDERVALGDRVRDHLWHGPAGAKLTNSRS
jgi:hypothetical protein